MTILDFIYNMSVWQWIGVFWIQLVFNYLILKLARITFCGIYDALTVKQTMDQMETLNVEELKVLRDSLDENDES